MTEITSLFSKSARQKGFDMKPEQINKVLVIDDSEFDRRMIVSAMKSVCGDVTCVELSSGAAVLETMRNEHPQLTIVDIRMPGISGWEVLERIRADSSLRKLNVVMMSGSSSELDIEKATEFGAHGFYTKPHTRLDYGAVATDLKTNFLDQAA